MEHQPLQVVIYAKQPKSVLTIICIYAIARLSGQYFKG